MTAYSTLPSHPSPQPHPHPYPFPHSYKLWKAFRILHSTAAAAAAAAAFQWERIQQPWRSASIKLAAPATSSLCSASCKILICGCINSCNSWCAANSCFACSSSVASSRDALPWRPNCVSCSTNTTASGGYEVQGEARWQVEMST